MNCLIFLIGILTYYTIGKHCQSFILTVLSLYAYWVVDAWNVIIIINLSIVVAIFSFLLERRSSKLLVVIPIMLIILAFCILRENYLGFALPIGFSVLSFTSISLLADQYRQPRHYGVFDTLSYLLFFPKIFAGPIERAGHFISMEVKSFNKSIIYTGIKFLIFASFCKFIVGDMISRTDMSGIGINQWMQIIIFAIGFFFDFWSYTLMAIGVSHIFGYKLSVSFNRPYYSYSFREFWHRWNITLGTWLRDYIYIPLGGKHNKPFRWSLIVMTVFLISGLWHGSTLPFLFWGVCHGLLLCVERWIVKPERLGRNWHILYGLVVFLLVAFLWQLFIIDSISCLLNQLRTLILYEPIQKGLIYRSVMCILATIALTSNKIYKLISGEPTYKKEVVAEVSLLSLMLLVLAVLNCTIYFNFFYFRF